MEYRKDTPNAVTNLSWRPVVARPPGHLDGDAGSARVLGLGEAEELVDVLRLQRNYSEKRHIYIYIYIWTATWGSNDHDDDKMPTSTVIRPEQSW